MEKDLNKYLLSKNISSTYQNDYFNNSQKTLLMSESLPSNIFQKLLDERIIFLTDEIDSDITNIIKAQLLYLDSESNDDISIYIDSPGGSIYSGLGLLDVMEYINSDIVTVNTGLAASMAAVILCSGTKGKRKALKRSRTMIHQPLSYGGWLEQASDMEIKTKEVISLKKELYKIISDNTGKAYKEIEKDSDRDYWMTSKEAKRYGIIDHIISKKANN